MEKDDNNLLKKKYWEPVKYEIPMVIIGIALILSLSNGFDIQIDKFEKETLSQSPIIISIGDNHTRKKIANRLSCEFEKAIHPSSIISPSVNIDEGTVVMAGTIINADANIGKHCIINTGASIDHECVVGDYVHISPHATLCGNVHIDEGSWIGAGVTVVPGIHIGEWCEVKAGAVVIHDVPDNAVVAGVPAKVIKFNK